MVLRSPHWPPAELVLALMTSAPTQQEKSAPISECQTWTPHQDGEGLNFWAFYRLAAVHPRPRVPRDKAGWGRGQEGPGEGLRLRMRQQRPQVRNKGEHCWLETIKHPSQCLKMSASTNRQHVSGSTEVLNEATSRVTKQKRNRDF